MLKNKYIYKFGIMLKFSTFKIYSMNLTIYYHITHNSSSYNQVLVWERDHRLLQS